MNILEARRRTLGKGVYKKTVEGNPAIAQGSLARMYPGITMQGWTEQDSTTGANLFDIASATTGAVSRITGENLEYGKNWKRSDYIQVVSGQQYSCTYVANYQDTGFAFYDEQKTFLSGIPCTTNFTVPESAVFCRITVNTTDGDPNIFMFNAGSTALPYEPYTGGKPSPSPDYPQEIVSAGKHNEDTGKWEYEVKLQGKNLFDFSNVISSGASMSVDYEKQTITIPAHKNNVGYTNTLRDVLPDAIVGTTCVINAKTSNPEANRVIYLLNKQEALGFGIPFKITDELLNDSFSWYNSPSTNNENVISEIQVEYGDTPTDYEPYRTPQTVLLQSDRPLTKWDRLEKRNGQWGWVYKSGEVIFNGSEGEDWEVYSNELEGTSFFAPLPGSAHGYQMSFCNKYKNVMQAWTAGYKNKYCIYSDHIIGDNKYFRPPSSSVETVEQWKTWLSENPLTLWNHTATETFVPLTAEEQEQMSALYTFRPTTVLSNDQGCEMTLTYKTRKSMEVSE